MSDDQSIVSDDPTLSSPERVSAFTDAVLAIIMTILVLEVAVPSGLSEQSLREALDEIGSTLIAWIISFFLVGMYWVWHRDLFNKVRAVNRDVVWLNIVFLLPVSLIPFAAAVLGDYHDEAIALRLYGLVLLAVTAAKLVLYWYVQNRPQLLSTPPSRRTVRLGLLLSAAPASLYAIAMALAGVSHQLSLAIYLAVPGAYVLLVTLLRDRPATADRADGFS